MPKSSGSFAKGVSGNPGGRPKAALDVQALARAHTVEAINALVAALKDKPSRVAAASALLDRGWGKPIQAVTGKDGAPLFPRITVLFGRDDDDT
jgi:Family of unknown function (DUF5681)